MPKKTQDTAKTESADVVDTPAVDDTPANPADVGGAGTETPAKPEGVVNVGGAGTETPAKPEGVVPTDELLKLITQLTASKTEIPATPTAGAPDEPAERLENQLLETLAYTTLVEANPALHPEVKKFLKGTPAIELPAKIKDPAILALNDALNSATKPTNPPQTSVQPVTPKPITVPKDNPSSPVTGKVLGQLTTEDFSAFSKFI